MTRGRFWKSRKKPAAVEFLFGPVDRDRLMHLQGATAPRRARGILVPAELDGIVGVDRRDSGDGCGRCRYLLQISGAGGHRPAEHREMDASPATRAQTQPAGRREPGMPIPQASSCRPTSRMIASSARSPLAPMKRASPRDAASEPSPSPTLNQPRKPARRSARSRARSPGSGRTGERDLGDVPRGNACLDIVTARDMMKFWNMKPPRGSGRSRSAGGQPRRDPRGPPKPGLDRGSIPPAARVGWRESDHDETGRRRRVRPWLRILGLFLLTTPAAASRPSDASQTTSRPGWASRRALLTPAR
jgi:hypothetical protein